MCGQIVVPNAVERKAGYLYYIDGQGNLCEAKMVHNGKSKQGSSKKKKIKLS